MKPVARFVALLLVFITSTQLIHQPAASATTFVSCGNGAGFVTFNPPFSLLPSVINAHGENEYGFCTGAGITDATAVYDGTVVGAACVPLTNTLLGTLNAGSITFFWTGGTGDPFTTFSWTVPAALQLGPSTSVILVIGYSTAGRFHIPLAPALLEFTVTFVNPQPPCPGTTHLDNVNVSLRIIDIA